MRHVTSNNFIFVLVLFLFFTLNKAMGQLYLSSPDTAFHSLDTLTVTAGRTDKQVQRIPYAFTHLEHTELRRVKKGLSVEEVLRTVPGVQVSNRFINGRFWKCSDRQQGSCMNFAGLKYFLINFVQPPYKICQLI